MLNQSVSQRCCFCNEGRTFVPTVSRGYFPVLVKELFAHPFVGVTDKTYSTVCHKLGFVLCQSSCVQGNGTV